MKIVYTQRYNCTLELLADISALRSKWPEAIAEVERIIRRDSMHCLLAHPAPKGAPEPEWERII